MIAKYQVSRRLTLPRIPARRCRCHHADDWSRHMQGPPDVCQVGLLHVRRGACTAPDTSYAASAVLAREKTLVMLVPRVVMIVMATIEMSTMISAYSTRPWPLPLLR